MSVSKLHDALLMLFRNRLSLAIELLRTSFSMTLPAFKSLRLEPNEVSEVRLSKHSVDLLLTLRDESDRPVNAAAKLALEKIMEAKWQYTGDLAKGYYRQGREEGREEGMEEGRLAGKAQSVLAVLEARGLAIPEPVRERVQACSNIAELEAWLRRAVSVGDAAALFEQ